MEWHKPDKKPNGQLLVHALVAQPFGDAREELVFHRDDGQWLNWNGGNISGELLLWQYDANYVGKGEQWTCQPPPAEAEGQQFEVQVMVDAIRLCHMPAIWNGGCWVQVDHNKRLSAPVFASRATTADDMDLDELLKNPE